MLRGPFLDRKWMGENKSYEGSGIVMLGMPFDGTVSYRPGARFAPEQIRLASWGLEDYSPYFDKHLQECNFHDAGDLELPIGNTVKALHCIEQNMEDLCRDEKRVLGIGGEHLITLSEIMALKNYCENLAIIHFDAHTDLREEYLGESLSHSAVMKQCGKVIGYENIKQIGVRSGTKEEFEFAAQYEMKAVKYEDLDEFEGKNVFVTVDLDVLDTSVMPGTGTPEAGGLTFNELIGWFRYLTKFNIIGADVVELAPDYDPTGASTAVAAKVIRELLMVM